MSRAMITAAGLAATIGVASLATAQQPRNQDERREDRREQRRTTPVDAPFVRLSNVIGTEVTNPAGQNLGEIEDAIVELNEGRILYGVLSFGGFLDIGDELIVIPWEAMTPAAEDRFMLHVSRERLESAESFEEDSLPDFNDPKFAESVYQRYEVRPFWSMHPRTEGRGSGGWGPSGRYARHFDPGTVEQLRGKIESIARTRPMAGMSQAVVIELTGDRGTQTVHLGPAWFLERQEIDLGQGDEVVITASRTELGDETIYIAADVERGTRTLHLRDQQSGQPAWSGWRAEERRYERGRRLQADAMATARASTLLGKNIRNRDGEEIGELEDMVVDRSTGNVAYAVVSFGGFLDIGDEVVALPWGTMSINRSGEQITLNVPRERLENAPRFSDEELAQLNSASQARQIYGYYEAEPEWVRSYYNTWWGDEGDAGAAGASRDFVRRYDSSAEQQWSGRVLRIDTASGQRAQGQEAAELTVQIDDEQRATVWLAPNWFMAHQDLRIDRGDDVTITGVQSTIEGDKVIVASTIEVGGLTYRLRDEQGHPVWLIAMPGESAGAGDRGTRDRGDRERGSRDQPDRD